MCLLEIYFDIQNMLSAFQYRIISIRHSHRRILKARKAFRGFKNYIRIALFVRKNIYIKYASVQISLYKNSDNLSQYRIIIIRHPHKEILKGS